MSNFIDTKLKEFEKKRYYSEWESILSFIRKSLEEQKKEIIKKIKTEKNLNSRKISKAYTSDDNEEYFFVVGFETAIEEIEQIIKEI